MAYDKESPIGLDIIAEGETEDEVLRNLWEQQIFTQDAIFYDRFHKGENGKLKINPPIWIGHGVVIDHTGDIEFDPYVLIGDFVVIYTHYHSANQERFWTPMPSKKHVGKYVNIGERATIMAECYEIGEGALILPGSVVMQSIPAWQVWGGNPAEFKSARPNGIKFDIEKEEKKETGPLDGLADVVDYIKDVKKNDGDGKSD